jgi:hypothetical protein
MLLRFKVLAGDVDPAIRTHDAFFSVWKKYGFTPEGFNLATLAVQVMKQILFQTFRQDSLTFEL